LHHNGGFVFNLKLRNLELNIVLLFFFLALFRCEDIDGIFAIQLPLLANESIERQLLAIKFFFGLNLQCIDRRIRSVAILVCNEQQFFKEIALCEKRFFLFSEAGIKLCPE